MIFLVFDGCLNEQLDTVGASNAMLTLLPVLLLVYGQTNQLFRSCCSCIDLAVQALGCEALWHPIDL